MDNRQVPPPKIRIMRAILQTECLLRLIGLNMYCRHMERKSSEVKC